MAENISVAEALRERIRRDGPLYFDEWMDACLYGPGGYYMRDAKKTGVGPDADFATAPTLHPFFSQAIAMEVHACWLQLGSPASFEIAEFGGGEGDLARGALEWLNQREPGVGWRWLHIEASPFHRARQADVAGEMAWIDQLPSEFRGAVVANEFVDALPFHWLEWRGEWQEVMVDWNGAAFVEQLAPARSAALAAAPDVNVAHGTRVVAMAAARSWIEDLGSRMAAGRVVIVDYGEANLWASNRADGTVRGFRSQQLVDSVLEDPGDVDITASVDFTALANWAGGAWGVEAETQEEFLLRHGVLDALNAVDRTTVEGASAYLRLRQLLLPTGMGAAFKVLRLSRQ